MGVTRIKRPVRSALRRIRFDRAQNRGHMTEIRIITETHQDDINIPNEPFRRIGRMIPSCFHGAWSYEAVFYDEPDATECFPDEHYEYTAMKDHSVFIGAYDRGNCVGLAILQKTMYRYMYLYDLKVSEAYRQKGVATALIRKAKEVCKEHGYSGIYTQAQDNNLAACLFYIKTGFYIGGLDTNIYRGTAQEGKADIVFYLDCEDPGL